MPLILTLFILIMKLNEYGREHFETLWRFVLTNTNYKVLIFHLLEPVVPGLALPKAFEDLEKQLESVASLCKLKGSHEAQTTGLLLVCNELQRLLRLSFIG